jgi:undecaprenyl pyrophosphate phosphatase UppP
VGEYETEKIDDKRWTKVLLGMIVALIVAACLGLRIETQFHKIFFDFLSG